MYCTFYYFVSSKFAVSLILSIDVINNKINNVRLAYKKQKINGQLVHYTIGPLYNWSVRYTYLKTDKYMNYFFRTMTFKTGCFHIIACTVHVHVYCLSNCTYSYY